MRELLKPSVGPSDVDPLLWTAVNDSSTSEAGGQFTTGAATYDERYGHSEHFLGLFKAAFAVCPISPPRSPRILDLGTGSGVNTVLPLLEIFEQPTIVATDLSPDLLTMLARRLASVQPSPRVLPVLMDAMSDHVVEGTFDLVTGAAILHHLAEPLKCLSMACRALKPGGTAIFFEPFEGHGLLRLAYQRILADGERLGLDSDIAFALHRIVIDTAARTSPDKTSASWQALEDKWLFSRDQFERLSTKAGFERVDFVVHNDHQTLFRDCAVIQLYLATGRKDLLFPDWAMAYLDEFDQAITAAGKRAMMLEGSIVLTRGV